MNQIRNRNEIRPRLYVLAKFYGKSEDDQKLNQLITIYLDKVMTTPKPSENTSPTKNLLELYSELDIDPDILEDGWWRYNSYYVAYNSVFGHTKNEWKNLVEYIIHG
jgi:hypothetical protein